MAVSTLSVMLCVVAVSVGAAPTVEAPWGRISGKDVRSPSGVPYHAYQGIPFALPPVGQRRFAKPEPHPGLGAGRVFNATSLGYICPQLELEVLDTFPAQSEDCLTLNVYAPVAPSDGLRSVMVWIYGGGFFGGSAAGYTPSRLVTDGDVIVVVIQYRLGIFGFLSSGDEVVAGNYGLFDQTLALKWVKDNIRAFGGDPATITAFGESAGAGSIGFHLLSPYSRGLFQRAVQQSGTPLAFWAINKNPANNFYKLAQRTGCTGSSSSWSDSVVSLVARQAGGAVSRYARASEHERLLACLRRVEVDKFMEHTTWLTDAGELNIFEATPWIPVVDGDFVPRPPEDLLNDADYLLANGALSVDVMLGVNNNEGGYILDFLTPADPTDPAATDDDKSNDIFTAFASFKAFDEDMERQVLTAELRWRYPELANDERRLNTLVQVLSFFYIKPLENGQVNIQGIGDTFADVYFTTGAVQMAKSLAKASLRYPQRATGGLYLYLFNHFPVSRADLPLQGVNHGEDLYYEFDSTQLMPQDEFNAQDFQVEENFIAMLTDFAKNGNTNTALGRQLGGNWPEYSLSEESYLSFGAQPRVEKQMYGERIALWLDLLPSLVNSTRQVSDDHCPNPMLSDKGNNAQQANIWYVQLQGRINKLWN